MTAKKTTTKSDPKATKPVEPKTLKDAAAAGTVRLSASARTARSAA